MKIIYLIIVFQICIGSLAFSKPIPNPITVESDTINFNSTIERLLQDTQSIVFENKTDQKYRFFRFEMGGKDKEYFKIVDFSQIERQEIDKKSTLKIDFSFPFNNGKTPPLTIGTKVAKVFIHFQADMMSGTSDSLFIITLIGKITPEPPPILKEYTLNIPKLKAKVGEIFNLPVIFSNIPKVADFQADTLIFNIGFNETMMTPTDPNQRGRFDAGNQILTIKKFVDLRNVKIGDTLANIECIAALGNSIMTPIVAPPLGFSFFKQEKLLNNFKVMVNQGSLEVTDIFVDDSVPRLITRLDADLAIKLDNTLITQDTYLKLYYDDYVAFRVFDLMGSLVYDYSNMLPAHNILSDETIKLQRSIFTKGIYLLKLTHNQTSVSKLILVN